MIQGHSNGINRETLQELSFLKVSFVSLEGDLDLTSSCALADMLAVFADYAERAVMQSHSAEIAMWPAF